MIISNQYKFIFIHIQKCAGTTVEFSYDKYARWDDLILGGPGWAEKVNQAYAKRFKLHKHSTADEVANVIGIDRWKDYFRFSFVRNPWDRLVSTYVWCRTKVPEGRFAVCRACKSMSFDEFVLSGEFKMLRPQSEYLYDKNGELLVDYVGRTEFFDKDLNAVQGMINLPVLATHKKNVSRKNGDYTSLYQTTELIETVAEHFRDDVRNFHYSFNDKESSS